jgi:hypothetical protein
MVVISHDVKGVSYEESDDYDRSFLLHLFTAPAEPSCFASMVVTLQGYKAGMVTPTQPTISRMISYRSSTFFPTAEKKENMKIDLKKQEGVVGLPGSHLSFPSVP